MRFLRNNDEKDTWLTNCMIPRWGYTYARCDPELNSEVPGSPVCPKTALLDPDPKQIECGGQDAFSKKHWECQTASGDPHPADTSDLQEAKCQCTIPPGYFYKEGAVDKQR